MKRSELIRTLATVEGFQDPDPRREQVATPPEAAVRMLESALARDDLVERRAVDLGSGPGRLAIGSALLGAADVVGVEEDPRAVESARRSAERLGVSVRFLLGPVSGYRVAADTVLMNPPFGAQRRHADRPFWDAAFAVARRRIYAFASSSSRTFIADSAVARGARVEATEPVDWPLPRTFPHHRKPSVALPVDLWVLAPATPPT